MNSKVRNANVINVVVFMTGLAVCLYTVICAHWIKTVDGDNAPLTYAVYSAVAESLHNGELPLWNPYIWGGFSNVGAIATQASYPINWILCFLFYDKSTELLSYAVIPANLGVHISIYFTGLFLLLRKLKTKSVDSVIICILSVMAFSFSKFFSWIVFFDGFSYFPFFVLATIFMLEGKRRGTVGLFALFTMEALLSVSQMLVIIIMFLTVLLITHMFHKKEWLKPLLKMFFSGILAIFFCAPVIIRQLIYICESKRYVPNVGWIKTSDAVPIEEFYSLRCSLEELQDFFNIIPADSWLSLGGVFVVLLLIGLCSLKSASVVYKWSVFGFFYTFFYAMGVVIPEIVYYIPLLNVLREPFLYACLFNFFAALVAANGIRTIRNCVEEKKALTNNVFCNKVLLILLGALFLYNIMPHNILSWKQLCYLALLVAFVGVLYFAEFKKYNFAVVYVLLIGALIANSCYFYSKMDERGQFNEREAVSRIQKVNENNARELNSLLADREYVGITSWGAQSLPLNQQALLGLRDAYGYYNPVSDRAVFLHNAIELDKRSQLQEINYFLLNENNTAEFIDYFEMRPRYAVFEKKPYTMNLYTGYSAQETESAYVYEVSNDLGAGWGVANWEAQGDMTEEQIAAWINDEKNDLSKTALIDLTALSDTAIKKIEMINTDNKANIDVDLVERSNNRFKFAVKSEAEAILVCAALYSSGWRAYVNGDKSELLQVDYTNIGTIVPKGEAEIEFVYCPDYIYGCVILQMAVVLIIVIYLFRTSKKRKGS